MEEKRTRFIMYSILFLILLVLALWVIKPFILTIIGGIIVAYIFYPVHKRIAKKIKSKGVSAFIVAILIVLIFSAPLLFITQAFVKDAYVSYVIIKQQVSSSTINGDCIADTVNCKFVNWLGTFVTKSQINYYVESGLGKVTQWVMNKANEIVIKIPALFLQLMVFLFVVYYALKEGKDVINKFWKMFDLKKKHSETLVKKTKEMINSTIYGTLVVAAIQGALASIGFFIFGVESPILLGVLIALAALIPIIGTAMISVPTVAFYLFTAFMADDMTKIWMGVGLAIYCIFPVALIDNLIKPKIIGDKAKVHPILVLLGILGGLAAFGIVGILLGPLIITLFVLFIDIYQEERLDHAAKS